MKMEHFTRKSLAKLAQQADDSVSSVKTDKKLPQICQYKVTRVYSLQ
jgi:hypothetical protein